ncbi:MAG: helix-turn-helix domain-containing protein [Thermomicrobiales bacterium]
MATTVALLTRPTFLTLAELRKQLNVSRERMGRLIDVSAKTIERWEARGEMPKNRLLRERLAQIQEIAELGLMVYTREGFDLFMTTPMGVFDNHTAMQMIEIGRGDEVFSAFAADYEGMGF